MRQVVSVVFARHARDITGRDTTGLLLSLEWVARSRADSCVCAEITVSNLFRDECFDALFGGCETGSIRIVFW